MPNSPSTIDAKLSTEHTPDTIKFFIACCQTDLTEEDTAFIISYLNTSLTTHHTSRIISMSARHGILPLIYKTLKKLLEDHPDTSSSLLNELKVQYLHIAQKNILMSAELLGIMKLFKENGIKALAFKGPTLSEMAYGDITLRQYGDLDILIKKEEIKKVEALCISMGYLPYYELTEVQKEVWYTYTKDMVFYHPQKQNIIEIHWLLLDTDFPIQIDLNRIWEQINTISLNKHPVDTFSSDSLLLYLCIHCSKHLGERIIWIKDIDQMIRTQNLNWESIMIEVQHNNLHSMFFLGLYLSQNLFDTPLPKQIEEALKNEKSIPELSHYVLSSWTTPQSMFQITKHRLKFFPSLKMKILYLHKIILKPSQNEYQFTDLPKGLYWVYYLIRPYLLLKKYLTKDQ